MSGSGNSMYRVGDFVYFEDSPEAPWQIRRIDELNKNSSNVVEAKVVLYHRRRDIPSSLLKIADQAKRKFDDYYEVDKRKPDKFSDAAGFTVANGSEPKKEEPEEGEKEVVEEEEDPMKFEWGDGGLPVGSDALDEATRFKLRQRELFLSRQVDVMPASLIRGKCRVTLLSEVETYEPYLNDDAFFYSLVFDPTNLTLLADKGAIRVGDKYQAVVEEYTEAEKAAIEAQQAVLKGENADEDGEGERNGSALMIDEDEPKEAAENVPKTAEEEKDRDVLVYHPNHSLSERELDQFLIMARAIGTFARGIEAASSTKLSSLHMALTNASRDITILHAYAILHQANYDIGEAVKFLVPPASLERYPLDVDKTTGHNTVNLGGPILCRDQLEEWSAPEANLFDEAIEKNGKDFHDIRAYYLPWKSMKDIIEYYYLLKTSTRYTDHKKKKQTELENKLKQVYIPNFNKSIPTTIQPFNTQATPVKSAIPCENCKAVEAGNWYRWGPASANLRLCQVCWSSWKKTGSLNNKHVHDFYDKDPANVTVTSTSNGTTAGATAQLTSVTPLQLNKINYHQKLVNAQNVIAQLPQGHPLMLIAQQQVAKGNTNFSLANLAEMARKMGVPGKTDGKSPSERRPPHVYYTTMWRKVLRRCIPKTVFNSKKIARRPLVEVDRDAFLRTGVTMSMSAVDKPQILQASKVFIGQRPINEVQFQQGLNKFLTSLASKGIKRPRSATHGEPAAKIAKI